MGSISKRRKRIKNKRSEEEDRINSLPSSLIGHILSFLPIKDAVKTSVLSTKWKYHWTSITNFYFYYRTPFGMRRDNCDQSVKSFINFVYQVLLQSVSDMHKFRLRCENKCDNSHLSQWISIAILRHVREVDISLVNEHVMLPRELWNCNTLVVLKLDGVFALNVPSMVCLPSLKILHLDKIKFSDDDSTERLVSSCPVLEDLALINCFWKNINVLNISALALKSLTIDSDLYDYNTFNYMYKIVFNTPNLQYLKYFDHVVVEGYSMNNIY
ncbi:F-box protein At4g22280-like [Cornus florida]|uniref:F-box protein At4g22280-like n=1 Tax=Cornus florida TaxID=4283 RepID=UPI00289E1EF9|nr:F-box protein At4g22280-like [Cornus florida]XP_059624189.1 F-box protein At4g22280-like [Cornus florida]